jgi:hypothetical protein
LEQAPSSAEIGRAIVGRRACFLIAPLAVQRIAQEPSPPFLGQYPRPLDQRRVVAHVLPVEAIIDFATLDVLFLV